AHPLKLATQQRAQQRRHLSERALLLVPGITERGMAITDVDCSSWDSQSVGEGAAAADDHAARRRGKPSTGPRVEWQQAPEVALADAEPVERRGVQRTPSKASAGALLVVQQREDRTLRIRLCDRSERPLGAAHDEQVVVGERRVELDLRLVRAHAA